MAAAARLQAPFPRLSDDTVQILTGNPSATSAALESEVLSFRKRLFSSPGMQLRQQLKHFPLPMTFCGTCRRATGLKSLRFAELCYAKTFPGNGLERVTAAVFSAMCGHKQPFCCDLCWNNLEVLEQFARHRAAPLEAPANPGLLADFSYAGTSIRLLPGAPLDLITQAFQKQLGHGVNPFLEMTAALGNLKSKLLVTTKIPLKSHLGSSAEVSAEVTDFSPVPSGCDETFVALFGRLAAVFRDDKGEVLKEVCLPSQRVFLGLVPHCIKGSYPRVGGKACYITRRFEERPNQIHVLKTKGGFECSLVSQNLAGEKRRLCFSLDAKKLIITKWVSHSRGQGSSVAVLTWLEAIRESLLREEASTPLLPDLCALVQKRLLNDFGVTLDPSVFLGEEGEDQPEDPAADAASKPTILHAPSDWPSILETSVEMITKLVAVFWNLRMPDSLHSSKTLNSASRVWEQKLCQAVRESLKRAGREAARGQSPSKNRIPRYELDFRTVSSDGEGGSTESSPPLLGEFYRQHGTIAGAAASHVSPSFRILFDKELDALPCCPLCKEEYSPPSEPTYPATEPWRCPTCSFQVSPRAESTELLEVKVVQKSKPTPRHCADCSTESLGGAWTCSACRTFVGGEQQLRLDRIGFLLSVAEKLCIQRVSLQILRSVLNGHCPILKRRARPQVAEHVSTSTEGSFRGPFRKRSSAIPPQLHQNVLDGRAGKDANPDIRIFMLNGSRSQAQVSADDLRVLVEELSHLSSRLLQDAEEEEGQGSGRIEVMLQVVARFSPSALAEATKQARLALHRAAWKTRNAELVSCCPVLEYSGRVPVVRFLCEGQELVQPVVWRRFTYTEKQLLDHFFAYGKLPPDQWLEEQQDLHDCWRLLQDTGLTLDVYLFAGILSWRAEAAHEVLREPFSDLFEEEGAPAADLDGLSFSQVSIELETSMRTLQISDAASWPAFHSVRIGMTSTAGISAHASERLSDEHGRASLSSNRSLGYDPCKSNIRNFIGNAPSDNSVAPEIQTMAVLHGYYAMQEDSMPCSDEVLGYEVFNHFVLKMLLPDHWERVCGIDFRFSLKEVAERAGRKYHPNVAEHIDRSTGLVSGSWVFLKKGQALCYVPAVQAPPKKKMYLALAPRDLWVKRTEAV